VATVEERDYLYDGGIHYLMGHRPGQSCHDIYRELGVFCKRLSDLETLFHFTDEITGNKVSFGND